MLRTRGYDRDGQGQRGGGLRFLLHLMDGALAQIPVTQTEADGGGFSGQSCSQRLGSPAIAKATVP